MPDAYALLKDFGFPALVVGLLLLRVEKRLDTLTRAVLALKTSFDRHVGTEPPPTPPPPCP